MAWENRHGRLFYYRKVREGKCVRSVYMGNGNSAEQCSEKAQENSHRQQQERLNRDADYSLHQQIDALDKEVTTLTKATLITAGFHQHKGTWRKKRR